MTRFLKLTLKMVVRLQWEVRTTLSSRLFSVKMTAWQWWWFLLWLPRCTSGITDAGILKLWQRLPSREVPDNPGVCYRSQKRVGWFQVFLSSRWRKVQRSVCWTVIKQREILMVNSGGQNISGEVESSMTSANINNSASCLRTLRTFSSRLTGSPVKILCLIGGVCGTNAASGC